MTYLTPAQGRQPKTGVMFLAWLNIYQNLKQAIQDVIAPEMQQLRGDIKAQNGEIKALSSEIAALRQELTLFESFVNRRFDTTDHVVNQRFSAVDTRLDGIDKRIDALASDWRLSLDVHERLAALEARLEKR
jgi:predicted nuclease with TOPRIM domain